MAREPKPRTIQDKDEPRLSYEGIPGDYAILLDGQVVGFSKSVTEGEVLGRAKLVEQARAEARQEAQEQAAMKVTAVTVRYSRTFNLGNFESVTFASEVTAEVEPGEHAHDVHDALFSLAKSEIKAQATPLLTWAKRRNEQEAANIRDSLPNGKEYR
jgi:hypothetical protein